MPDQTNPANPQSQGAGDAGDKTKLYAGKYKTPEELEAGYKELERGFHETRQEISQLKEVIETRFQPVQASEYGQGGQYTQPVQPSQEQATQVLTNFYRDPIGTLRQVTEAAVKEAEDRISKKQTAEERNRQRVEAWLEKNQDVKQHGDLLGFYVSQTDGRLAIEERLSTAAKRTRERLAELRGSTPQNAEPNPGSFIPGPSGSREGAPQGGSPQAAPATDAESQLAKYANERNAGRIKRPGTHRG